MQPEPEKARLSSLALSGRGELAFYIRSDWIDLVTYRLLGNWFSVGSFPLTSEGLEAAFSALRERGGAELFKGTFVGSAYFALEIRTMSSSDTAFSLSGSEAPGAMSRETYFCDVFRLPQSSKLVRFEVEREFVHEFWSVCVNAGLSPSYLSAFQEDTGFDRRPLISLPSDNSSFLLFTTRGQHFAGELAAPRTLEGPLQHAPCPEPVVSDPQTSVLILCHQSLFDRAVQESILNFAPDDRVPDGAELARFKSFPQDDTWFTVMSMAQFTAWISNRSADFQVAVKLLVDFEPDDRFHVYRNVHTLFSVRTHISDIEILSLSGSGEVQVAGRETLLPQWVISLGKLRRR